jgi:hypothetical protein
VRPSLEKAAMLLRSGRALPSLVGSWVMATNHRHAHEGRRRADRARRPSTKAQGRAKASSGSGGSGGRPASGVEVEQAVRGDREQAEVAARH